MDHHEISAESLVKRYSMSGHVENGAFIERHYENDKPGRAASGSIYYYVAPDERTKFHVIDCDEYWCYIEGSSLEVWMILPDGSIEVQHMGIEEGCEPVVFVKSGTIFASRHGKVVNEGTFLSCITVPRFEASGFKLIEDDEVQSLYPKIREFYSK